MQIFNSNNTITNFKNPFLKDSVGSVVIEIRKPNIIHKHFVEATVYFINGGTRGSHEICGDDLGEVVLNVQKFIDSL